MPVKTMDKKVKGYLLWEIQNYPQTKRRLNAVQNGVQSRHEACFSNLYLQRLEKTTMAIEKVLQKMEPFQVELLELLYWRKTHNAAGVGMQLGASERTIYRWLDQIVYDVGRELGYWM